MDASTSPSARQCASITSPLRSARVAGLGFLLCAIAFSLSGCSNAESTAQAPAEDSAATRPMAEEHTAEEHTAEVHMAEEQAAGNASQSPPKVAVEKPVSKHSSATQNSPTHAPQTEPAKASSSTRPSRIPVVDGPAIPGVSNSESSGWNPPLTQNDNRDPRGAGSATTTDLANSPAAAAAASAPVAPAAVESSETKQAGESVDSLATKVKLYFATDRLPTTEVLPGMFRTFLPALAVACICWAMFVGMTIARRLQTYWMIGAAVGTCMGVIVLHTCIIRWQQYSRFANNSATRFSVMRFEPDAGQYPLHLGQAEITLPPDHETGVIERPSLMRLEFVESADKHVMLQSVDVDENPADWFGAISEQVKYASEREGFVFIHGYNVKFADALMRTAQLSHDLDVPGPVISFSWPSKGQLAAYAADEASVSWSAPHLERLLIDLVSKTEVRKVNIVAHSMGNRALLESLERLNLRMSSNGKPPTRKVIGSLILAAPDIDAQLFDNRYAEAVNNVADRATIYFTDADRALQLSKKLHASPRLGLGTLPKASGIEAVHTGEQGLFSLGHSYYGSDRVVIDDMHRVLRYHASAKQRDYLEPSQNSAGLTYWRIDRDRHALLHGSLMR